MSHSPRDLVIAQIEHQETDPLPYTLDFEGDVAERLDAYYGDDGWRALLDNAIHVTFTMPLDYDPSVSRYHTDRYGCVWDVSSRPIYLIESPLVEPSLDGLALPDLEAIYHEAWRRETVQAVLEAGRYFTVLRFDFGLFERTWMLRGFENALVDAALRPAFYAELVGRLAEHQMEIIEHLLRIPADGIMFGDDWGYQRGVILGAERWRRFLKPHLARMYARVHQAGKVVLTHCCGSIEEILPDLIEIGLDVYQSVQPEAANSNPYELKRKYGDRMTFWGGLGSQSTIPFGTSEAIRAEVARLCREMGRGGGYILSGSKHLQPETPIENAAAVVESFLAQAGVDLAEYRT